MRRLSLTRSARFPQSAQLRLSGQRFCWIPATDTDIISAQHFWTGGGGRPMRGWDERSDALFSYVSCEARVPKDHPLRPIQRIVDKALAAAGRNRTVTVVPAPPCDRRRGDDRAFHKAGSRWLVCTVIIQRNVTPLSGWR